MLSETTLSLAMVSYHRPCKAKVFEATYAKPNLYKSMWSRLSNWSQKLAKFGSHGDDLAFTRVILSECKSYEKDSDVGFFGRVIVG